MRLTSHRYLVVALLCGMFGGPFACAAHTRAPVARPTTAATPHPGDIVRVRIWREPDLSGEFPVNELGEVTLPRVGRLAVRQLSVDSVQRLLVTEYATYLRDPSVEVTVLRRVSVQGAVRAPGVFHVDPTMSLSDVLALSGGASERGTTKRLALFRDGQRIDVALSPETTILDSPVRSGDQIWVPERSWWSRNTSIIAATLTTVGLVVAALIPRQ